MPVDGNKVVLLHGWGGTFSSTWAAAGWDTALKRIGSEPEAVDLPGHGLAPQSHTPADYADLASLTRSRLPDAGPIDAIGFSLGAKLLIELASREPHRFRRLVLGGVGGNAFAPEPIGEHLAAVLERGVAPHTPRSLAALANEAIRPGNDPLALAAVLRRPANPVLTADKLSRLTAAILLVAGQQDTVAQPLGPLADALPTAKVLMLPNAEHFDLPADDRFKRAALAFLAGS